MVSLIANAALLDERFRNKRYVHLLSDRNNFYDVYSLCSIGLIVVYSEHGSDRLFQDSFCVRSSQRIFDRIHARRTDNLMELNFRRLGRHIRHHKYVAVLRRSQVLCQTVLVLPQFLDHDHLPGQNVLIDATTDTSCFNFNPFDHGSEDVPRFPAYLFGKPHVDGRKVMDRKGGLIFSIRKYGSGFCHSMPP